MTALYQFFLNKKNLKENQTKLFPGFFDVNIKNTIKVSNITKKPLLTSSNTLSINESKKNQIKLYGDLKLDSKTHLFSGLDTEFTTKSNLSLECSEFKNLIQNFSSSLFAIPAPLNQLNGSIKCSLADNFSEIRKTKILFLNCDTNLKSKDQIYDLSSNLGFSFQNSKLLVLGEVIIKDILFTLPEISLQDSIPSFSNDKRILIDKNTEKNEEEGKSNLFDYKIHLKSQNPKSIKIKSNILKPSNAI